MFALLPAPVRLIAGSKRTPIRDWASIIALSIARLKKQPTMQHFLRKILDKLILIQYI
jgi:hypothetical protein